MSDDVKRYRVYKDWLTVCGDDKRKTIELVPAAAYDAKVAELSDSHALVREMKDQLKQYTALLTELGYDEVCDEMSAVEFLRMKVRKEEKDQS